MRLPVPPALIPPRSRSFAVGCLLSLMCSFIGCHQPQSLEITGAEVRKRLPEAVVEIVPADAVLCFDEEKQDGAYHLWVLRKSGGTWLDYPKPNRKRTEFEHHNMPTSAIESILRSKLPSLALGTPLEKRCRYTHWQAKDRAEIQVREFVTDQGWFASVEQVRF